MGERKGQNKYYPPDYDPKVGGLNKFLGTHALRERANKIHLGILIIRFEMPYNIWCDGCKNHIGMGVRYNAEKTKVGMYYSTVVYQFRMKCHLCDNYIEIKTDPGNLDYAIVSGARRQENRWDPTENGQIVADTKEVQRKLFDDPMYKLEHVASDQQKAGDAKPRLGQLYERNHYVWDDDFAANSRLRQVFRKRKQVESVVETSKINPNIVLLPETDQDKNMASLICLQAKKSTAMNEKERIDNLINESVLPSATITSFAGTRTQKLLNERLCRKGLGIVKKRRVTEATATSASALAKMDDVDVDGKASLESDGNSSTTCDTAPDFSIMAGESANIKSSKGETLQIASTSVLAQGSYLSSLLQNYGSSGSDSD